LVGCVFELTVKVKVIVAINRQRPRVNLPMTITPSDESVFNRSSILVFNQSPFGLRNVADIIWFGVENSKQDGFRTHAEMSSNLLLDALFLAIFFF
jgi:hypothetical protein